MNEDKKTPRLLGAAFLFVLVASILSEALLSLAIGSGSISDILVTISNNLTLMRISNLVVLVLQSTGIIVLAVLLYIVLNKQNKIIALSALAWWLAEAITLAVSKIGAFALIPLSQEFVKAGTPTSSYYQTLGEFLYYGVDRLGYDIIHMVFYCMGGILWFYLFYKSKYIPRGLSVWGLAAETLALIGVVLLLLGVKVNILFFAHIAVLELVMGLWLMVKGIQDSSKNV